jgi:hypothetical protein
MWCDDPLLSMLKAFGYSVVRLPRADLAPLRLLARLGRDLEEIGLLEALLMPGPHVPLPRVARDRPSPALSGLHSASLDVGLGLSLLASLLASLGGSPQAAHVAWRRARRVSFVFETVREDSVALVDVDQYLADARINGRATQVGRLLEADDLYLTTSVVKSRAFTVTATDEGGAALELDVPAVGALAGAAVTVTAGRTEECGVRFEGREPLGFGFRALRLFFDGGRYSAFKPLAPGDLALARSAPAPEWYESEAPFVRLDRNGPQPASVLG